MESRRSQAMSARLVTLMALIQVPLSSAIPFYLDSPRYGRSFSDVLTITSTCEGSEQPTPTRTVVQISDGQVQVPAMTTATGSPQASNVVVQISDEKIQVPQAPATEPSVSYTSSSSTTSVLSARDLTTQSSVSGLSSANFDAQSSTWTTSVPDSNLTSLTTSQVQSASSTELGPTSTSGSVSSGLDTSAQPTSQPFPTHITSATSSLSLVNTETLGSVKPTDTIIASTLSASDIFQPIGTGAPPAQISQRSDHPVSRTGIQTQARRLQTNKFYSGLFLAGQTSPVYTFPYSVSWAKGGGELQSWGMAISHTEPGQWATAPGQSGKDAGEWAFFGAPVGIQHVVLSATELAVDSSNNSPGLTTEQLEWGSVRANLFPPSWLTPIVSFPLLQGTPFITANYSWATPFIQSSVGFLNLTYAGEVVEGSTHKYIAVLRDQTTWLFYITPSDPSYEVTSLTLDVSGTNINCHSGFNGIIQVAKVPRVDSTTPRSYESAEDIYDSAAGAYPTDVSIKGSVENTTGSYTLSWTKAGVESQELLMLALPHHVSTFDETTRSATTGLKIRTTTKGMATAVRGTSWTMIELDLPIDMSFGPWSPSRGTLKTLSSDATEAISEAGMSELKQNYTAQTNGGSAYYDGKALAKLAAIVYTLHEIAGDVTLALTGLQILQEQFARHVNNTQRFPIVYESAWGGAVSIATYETGEPLADFGNTYYNDHHFHYGYFVYAASVIGYLDPNWLQNEAGAINKEWVNMLVRDYANSDLNDTYFPFSRTFDFYHGHSWAAGLFDSGDGKNQESSSEDTMASYAIKMWGRIIDDKNMEARGNLILAIQRTSFENYYLYDSTNSVLPKEFVGNKVAGILFENKIDHTTYFGARPEYIQGIHMIPIMPFSTYIRSSTFVTEEWAAYFSNLTSTGETYVSTVQGGWRGLLMANYAMCNTSAAYEAYDFFSNPELDAGYLDGGASLTWYRAWTAALMG